MRALSILGRFLLCFQTCFLSATAAEENAGATAWTMARSEEREVVSAAGDQYRVMISWPEGEAPEKGWPVVYVLDGDHAFPIVTSIMRGLTRSPRAAKFDGVDPGVVVGIGYYGESRRSFDYTPPAPEIVPDEMLKGTAFENERNGGADRFLDFIEKDLKPLVEQSYRIDRGRQSLMGHSYGGLFALHAMFTRPEMFQTYVASSPSIWWNREFILSEEKSFLTRMREKPLPLRLVMSIGEYEQSLTPGEIDLPPARREQIKYHRGRRRMVDNSRELGWRLERLEGMRVTYQIFPMATHGSVVAPAVCLAMPVVLAPVK